MRTPILESDAGQTLSLTSMSIKAELSPLMGVVELKQVYRNDDKHAIEAIYSFPLPRDGVLLGVEAYLGQKKLTGTVIARSAAETAYENAVADGDTAIMLEEAEQGLYTMNVGNLMPGEELAITLRYAILLRWEEDQLRFALPMTVAPRYGDWQASGVQPHQIPVVDSGHEQELSLTVAISEALALKSISSPTHRVRMERWAGGAHLISAEKILADRDFVLLLQRESASRVAATVLMDGDAHVVAMTFPVQLPTPPTLRRSLKIVLDCSGSMGGDSIAHAKHAVIDALRKLSPSDEFCITAFGSRYLHFADRMTKATKSTIEAGMTWVNGRDADMGGTEMGVAVQAAMMLRGEGERSDVLLVTDGEITDAKTIGKAAQRANHRLFVVGIGASPAGSGLLGMARDTSGHAVFSTPNEDIGEAIAEQFRRIGQECASIRVVWPAKCTWSTGDSAPVYVGDTAFVFAGFATPPSGTVTVELIIGGNVVTRMPIALASSTKQSEVPRIAAAMRIRELDLPERADKSELAELAVKYQLLTPYSNFLMLHERAQEQKGDGNPQLKVVPNMLAAGWGGTGSVVDMPTFMRVAQEPAMYRIDGDARPSRRRSIASNAKNFFETRVTTYFQISPLWNNADDQQPNEFLKKAHNILSGVEKDDRRLVQLDSVLNSGIDSDVSASLRQLIDAGWLEEHVVLAFWLVVLNSSIGHLVQRYVRRAILRTTREPQVDLLVPWIGNGLENLSATSWSWRPERPLPTPASQQRSAVKESHVVP